MRTEGRLGKWMLLIPVLAGLSGCLMPPDVAMTPDFADPPAFPRDRQLTDRQPIASEVLNRTGTFPDQHQVILLECGDDALLARIHMIRAARESIDIQTFIWVYDETGIWVYKELLEAARRGVKVRLLIDQFVPPGITAAEYAGLVTAHENLEVRLFRPVSVRAINNEWTFTRSTFTRFTTMNRRMHNKVFLVDGQVAILGGRNIQNAYYDRDAELCFRDRDVLVSGPSVPAAQDFFNQFWTDLESVEATQLNDLREAIVSGNARIPDSVSGPLPETFAELDQLAEKASLTEARPSLSSWTVERIRFLSDNPDDARGWHRLGEANPFGPLIEVLAKAETEVIIQTPYPILGSRSRKLARRIYKNSPEARIRVSTNSLSSSDHSVVSGIAFKQRRNQIQHLRLEMHIAKPVPGDIREMVPRYDELLRESKDFDEPDWENDPDIIDLEIEGPRFCVHAKSVVIDRASSFVGSHNFDPRSFSLNSECGVLIEDAAFSRHLAGIIEQSMHPRNSWVLAEREFPPLVQEVNSLIASVSALLPMFDVWPLEHVSAYDLKEGCQPLSPYHPDFHRNYSEAGVFPGLDLSLKSVQVALIRAFGGLSAPLM